MTSCFVDLKRKLTWLRPARLAIASVAAVIASGDHMDAASRRNEPSVTAVESRTAGEPIMAIVSLRDQRITVYDKNGWILRAPVSSGQKGRETPAGIFSVIQKEAEHYSNLYDDAYMPHMQRITWSGIALHGGPLPGHPASHGCVRMPYDFAEQLFNVTTLGLRVIVAPSEVAPVEFAHPALFPLKSGAGAIAAARAAEVDEATSKADQAKLAAVTASKEAARAMIPVRVAENLKHRRSWQPPSMRSSLHGRPRQRNRPRRPRRRRRRGSPSSRPNWPPPTPSCNRSSTPWRLLAKPLSRQRPRGLSRPRRRARWRATSRLYRSSSAARLQRLYVRQAFQPILESPVTIRDADRPLAPMSSPPWSAPAATTCDGAWSRWMAEIQMMAWSRHTALRADAAVETQSRPRPTQVVRKPRSTGSPFHRTYWIVSKGWRPRVLP